jgi:hypothetical protein
VEAIGEHVKSFKVGDEALAQFGGGNRGASYQVVAVVKEGMVARKPGGGHGRGLQACRVCLPSFPPPSHNKSPSFSISFLFLTFFSSIYKKKVHGKG